MEEVTLIAGELFTDHRGTVASLNRFLFDEVRRCYFLRHPDCTVKRGWNGHRYERKWFYPLRGEFEIELVRIDDWEHPSADLPVQCHRLSDTRSEILCVPGGFASCIRATQPDSILMVGSDKTLDESVSDSWKFPIGMWNR
ncbi:MAG: dTDP-6-deoxy-3,4-keto-hexulose isomerase [Paludibacteraceae bacterium]|nr:dTDP-6-deoxy-3,4-keto-hexulose isomerase [Paludibacteraceae bacterium]